MTKAYAAMTTEELQALHADLQKKYEEFKAMGLKLDMSRGKPSAAQLDLSMEMMDVLNSKCRKYHHLWQLQPERDV